MSVLDLRQTTLYFSRDLTLLVAQPGAFIDGYWQKANPAYLSETIKGDLQTPNGKDLEMLPEGERLKSIKKLFTIKQLFAGGERVDTESDLINDNGKIYKVIKTFDYSEDSYTYKSLVEFVPTGIPA
jgi:hypothetical protein